MKTEQTTQATQQELVRAKQEENALKEQIIELLSGIAQTRSILLGTEPHLVAEVAQQIARHIQLDQIQCEQIRIAALICDIGMISIPESIPRKKGMLTENELACLRLHAEIGVNFLKHMHLMVPILPLIRHHHERWDGTGYPDHLAGEAIPLGARIIAVADAFVSMQGKRAYRAPLTGEEALTVLRDNAGTQFDQTIVQALLQIQGNVQEILKRAA